MKEFASTQEEPQGLFGFSQHLGMQYKISSDNPQASSCPVFEYMKEWRQPHSLICLVATVFFS